MVLKDRSNDDPKREVLTDEERKVVRIAKDEAVRHLERKYKLSSLMPFLADLKEKADFRQFVKDKVISAFVKIGGFMGIDKESKNKLILFILLVILFCIIIGPDHTLSIVLKWLGE